MRLTTLLTILALGQAGAVQNAADEAENIFNRMEKNLFEAKTIQFKFKAVGDGVYPGSLDGSASLERENKERLKLKGLDRRRVQDPQSIPAATPDPSDHPINLEMVSDGSFLLIIGQPGSRMPTPKSLGNFLTGSFSRIGLFLNHFHDVGPNDLEGDADIRNKIVVGGFKKGAAERVGERECQIIEFEISVGKFTKGSSRLWIDSKTFLPVKRIVDLELTLMNEKTHVSESYDEVKLDEKIDPALFRLPESRK